MMLTDSNHDLVVRAYEPSDAPFLHAAALESLTTVGHWLPWCHANYTLADAQSWVARSATLCAAGTEYPFGIFEMDSGRLLGGVGINRIVREYAFGNLGYWIRSSATGRGIATNAARLAARFALTDAKLARVEITIPVGNLPSQRVAEKLGASYEGIARQRLIVRGESVDAWQYSLTRQDLTALA